MDVYSWREAMDYIVTLSDIHFRDYGLNKHIFSKREKFIDALKSVVIKNSNLIFIVNGDVADKGADNEFKEACSFFKNVRSILIDYGINVSFIFNPGNHDCNINLLPKEELLYRKELRVKNKVESINVDSISKLSDKHLGGFNRFVKQFSNDKLIKQTQFYNQYLYRTNGFSINIISFKSAIAFDLEATQGDFFQDSKNLEMNIQRGDNDITLSLSHYPIEWYKRDDSNFYKILEDTDVLVTGHEHISNVIRKQGNSSNYIEIKSPSFATFNETEKSGFHITMMDLEEGTMEVKEFTYKANLYRSSIALKKLNLKQTIMLGNAVIPINKKNLSAFMDSKLTPYKNSKILSFDDVFVEPYFSYSSEDQSKGVEIEFKGYSEIDFWDSSQTIFIKGGSQVGKTFAMKKLFIDYYKKGMIPIYIESSPKTNISTIIDKAIDNFYEDRDVVYQSKSKVVLLIDNLDNYKNGADKVIKELINMSFFKIIATLSDDLYDYKFESITDNNINLIRILPFGHKQKFDLIEKWVSKDSTLDQDQQTKRVLEIKRAIDDATKIGNMVNTPTLVIIFLEAYEEKQHDKLVKGSKGVYYDYLINKYLIQLSEASTVEVSVIENYLCEIAYFIFKNNKFKKKDFDSYYLDKYPESPRMYYAYSEKINKALENQKLADTEINGNIFNYSFMFSYFCARYFIININDKMDEILSLLVDIHDDEIANIILFIVHWTKDNRLVDKIVEMANSLFKDSDLIQNNKDLDIINQFIIGIDNIQKSSDVRKENRELFEKIDRIERESSIKDETKKKDVKNEHSRQLITSLKLRDVIMEILSQKLEKQPTLDLIKSNLHMGLRKSRDYLMYFYFSLLWLSKQENRNEIAPKFIKDRIMTMVYIFAELNDQLAPSNLFDFVIDEFESENNNVYIKKIVAMLKLFRSREKDYELSTTDMNSIVDLRDWFLSEKNFLSAGYINALVSREMNYYGMLYKTKNQLFQKMNSQSLSANPSDPKAKMKINQDNKKKRLDMLKSKK